MTVMTESAEIDVKMLTDDRLQSHENQQHLADDDEFVDNDL